MSSHFICPPENVFILKQTATSIVAFLLCMMVHPKVQLRVHEELDRVIGLERLPTYEDRTSLAYIQAAWKEASRWHPIVPFGMN